MTQGFVWFHNSSDNPADSSTFYEELLGWRASEGPGGMTMLAGESGPFAGVARKDSGNPGLVPARRRRARRAAGARRERTPAP